MVFDRGLGDGLISLIFGLALVVTASAQANPPESEKSPLIDRFEATIANTVNGSAHWVDGFFGDSRQKHDAKGAFGRLSFLPYFYEYNGIDAETRFRAYIPLDNINERFSAIIGRGDEDELIANDYGFESLVPRNTSDDAWLAGFGYKPAWSKKGRFSLGAGVKFDWPPDPYVRLSYRFVHNFSEESLMRFRQSVYWQNTENIGSITSIDLERRVTKDNLLRWSNWAKASGKTEQVRYDTRIALYRNLQNNRGVVFAIGMRGDSGEEVPVRDYGVFAVYRQQMWREWFYGQILAGVTGYREDHWPERRLAMIAGLGFEIFFSADKDYTDSLQAQMPWTLGGRF
jgi:hypothetical protein